MKCSLGISNFLWRPTGSSRTNTQKRCPFQHRGLECKSRKSRDTWSNRQIWPWSAKWSRAKANRVLPRERTGHSKHPLPTTQETTLHMDITTWSKPKSVDNILCSQTWRSSIQSPKTRLGADCGCKEYNQSDFGIDYLMMSMCRVFSCICPRNVGRMATSRGSDLVHFIDEEAESQKGWLEPSLLTPSPVLFCWTIHNSTSFSL